MTNIAIIGSGPTAIYTAKYLLEKCTGIAITIFEKQNEAGKGTPYHQDWNDKSMLSNIAGIEIPRITETLVDWLFQQNDMRLAGLGIDRSEIDERAFFPRIALGEYFQAQLNKLTAKNNFLTVKTNHNVIDAAITQDDIKITIKNNKSISQEIFDYVVMATGHAWPKETEVKPGYFASPWPASALKTIGNCHVGIRGTSLSAIDAMSALATARGAFMRDESGALNYLPEPGTESFHITMISRKGLLPEADFYHPIPYLPLKICTVEAVDRVIASGSNLLDKVFLLFKAELAECDPGYAKKVNLSNLNTEEFCEAYFCEREQHDQFAWAAQNLAEAKLNQAKEYTVLWRYAILRMHEVIARIVPHLSSMDYKRFGAFKQIFVDDYATVPHESIERLLAMHRAGKLEIIKTGEDYQLETENIKDGALLIKENLKIHFPAFIEAMGQRTLSARNFPFPTLLEQGIIRNAVIPYIGPNSNKKVVEIGGIALDETYHPLSETLSAPNLYCLSLPFILGLYPFAQGITSSHDMGKAVAEDIAERLDRKGEIHHQAIHQ